MTAWQKNAKRLLWLLAILGLVVAGKYGVDIYLSSAKPAQASRVIAVERGDIESVVSATGTIAAVNSVDISSKITGLIREVKINENDWVKEGDVLVVLDDKRLKAQLSQAEARLANTSANYARMQSLFAIGAISNQQLDSALMDYNVAQASYDDASSQLEDTVIKSPIAGIVIGKPVPAGQTVSPGISTPMVLLTIADMSKMQIQAQIDESDIGKVVLRQKATFTVDAYPGKTFTGIVSNVSSKANIQQNVVYYPVIIDVDQPEGLLKPTMTARVSINVGERKNVLVVPLQVIKESKGQRYVQILEYGQPQNVNITTGLSSDEKIEVISGLKEGDQVVLPQARSQTQPQAGPSLRGMMR